MQCDALTMKSSGYQSAIVLRFLWTILILAPVAVIAGDESKHAPRWVVREFASLDDYASNKPCRELSFSPIVILDEDRELSLNLKPGREPDDSIMEILDGQMLITLRAFRRAWAKVIIAMPCQGSLEITTDVVPFVALEHHLGKKPDNWRRVANFKVDSCLPSPPRECAISTESPQYGAYEYAEFRRDLLEAAQAMQEAYQATTAKAVETKAE
jgi:hypothetical protein